MRLLNHLREVSNCGTLIGHPMNKFQALNPGRGSIGLWLWFLEQTNQANAFTAAQGIVWSTSIPSS